MPPPGGTRAIAAIRRADPLVRVVALSGLAEADAAIEALRAGASGFLPKTADPEALVRPLLAVLDVATRVEAAALAGRVGLGAESGGLGGQAGGLAR